MPIIVGPSRRGTDRLYRLFVYSPVVFGSFFFFFFILFGSGPLGTDQLYGFLCLARCASNCLAKVFKFFVVRRSIFGGYSIRRLNKGKTLLLITSLMKLGFLLSILIAYCCRNRGRGLITFWNGNVYDWLGSLSGDR